MSWDQFWDGYSPIASTENKAESTWSDIAWIAGLEFWEDVFRANAPGKKLLECGCGSARLSQYMAHRGYETTLMDNSEKAVELARQSFELQSLKGSFSVGDLHSLNFNDKEFDVVFSGGVLHHFKNIEAPIREMVRVLKSGGLFAANVITDKFSCQSLANIEVGLANFAKNLIRRNWNSLFNFNSSLPFYVNSLPPQSYIETCEKNGLRDVVGFASCPFPHLLLPPSLRRLYGRFLRKMLPFWKRFNRSQSSLATQWGVGFNIYGFKK